MVDHDFKNYPELTNAQLNEYLYDSPHPQIMEDFEALCVGVHDADTIKVRWEQRDFDFPIRISNTSARELKETSKRDTSGQLTADGKTAQKWLEALILNKMVKIRINKDNRVEKFGRLLGQVELDGIDVGETGITLGMVAAWDNRQDGKITDNIRTGIE